MFCDLKRSMILCVCIIGQIGLNLSSLLFLDI